MMVLKIRSLNSRGKGEYHPIKGWRAWQVFVIVFTSLFICPLYVMRRSRVTPKYMAWFCQGKGLLFRTRLGGCLGTLALELCGNIQRLLDLEI